MKRGLIATASLLVAGLASGCHSRMERYPGGLFGSADAGCNSGACAVGDAGDLMGGAGLAGGGASQGGPLAHGGYHHQGPQSHEGPGPGPAAGPASPTYGYPYYTTRGPRDFLNPNPPSIGR
jgi:hypothetical protein